MCVRVYMDVCACEHVCRRTCVYVSEHDRDEGACVILCVLSHHWCDVCVCICVCVCVCLPATEHTNTFPVTDFLCAEPFNY